MKFLANLNHFHAHRRKNVYLTCNNNKLEIRTKFINTDASFSCGHSFDLQKETFLKKAINSSESVCPKCKTNQAYFFNVNKSIGVAFDEQKHRKTQGRAVEMRYPKLEKSAIELGKGGYGSVNERIAIFAEKQFKFYDDMITEAAMMSYLKGHDNVIQFFAVNVNFSTKDFSYIIPKYQKSLFECIQHNKTLAKSLSNNYFSQQIDVVYNNIGNAINYIHTQNVIHNDIKLANILLEIEPTSLNNTQRPWKIIKAILIDFGISVFIANATAPIRKDVTMIQTDTNKAPELFDLWNDAFLSKNTSDQYLLRQQMIQYDIWAFGVVVYGMAMHSSDPFRVSIQSSVNRNIYYQKKNPQDWKNPSLNIEENMPNDQLLKIYPMISSLFSKHGTRQIVVEQSTVVRRIIKEKVFVPIPITSYVKNENYKAVIIDTMTFGHIQEFTKDLNAAYYQNQYEYLFHFKSVFKQSNLFDDLAIVFFMRIYQQAIVLFEYIRQSFELIGKSYDSLKILNTYKIHFLACHHLLATTQSRDHLSVFEKVYKEILPIQDFTRLFNIAESIASFTDYDFLSIAQTSSFDTKFSPTNERTFEEELRSLIACKIDPENARNEMFDPILKKSKESNGLAKKIITLSGQLQEKKQELAHLKESSAKNTVTYLTEQEGKIQILKETLSEWEKLVEGTQLEIKQKENTIEMLRQELSKKEMDSKGPTNQNQTNQVILEKEEEIKKLKTSENELKKEIADCKVMLEGKIYLSRLGNDSKLEEIKTLKKEIKKLKREIEKGAEKTLELPKKKPKQNPNPPNIPNTNTSQNDSLPKKNKNNNNIPGYSEFSLEEKKLKKKTKNVPDMTLEQTKKKPKKNENTSEIPNTDTSQNNYSPKQNGNNNDYPGYYEFSVAELKEQKKPEEKKNTEETKKKEEKNKTQVTSVIDLISSSSSDEDQ